MGCALVVAGFVILASQQFPIDSHLIGWGLVIAAFLWPEDKPKVEVR